MLEEVAQKPRAVGAQGGPLILEVGCGSGAISLSLLSQLPQVSILSTPPPPQETSWYYPALSPPSRPTRGLLGALEGQLPGLGLPSPPLSQPPPPIPQSGRTLAQGGDRCGNSLLFWPGLVRLVSRPGLSQHLPPMCPSLVLGAEPSRRCG